MDIGRLRELLSEVKDDNRDTQKIMDDIVDYYAKDLDELVERVGKIVRNIREGHIDEYSDDELELDIIEISAQMYSASRELAKLGGESDLAKHKRAERFNDVLSRVSGTAAEKKAKAEKMVMEESVLEDIYKRAYDQLKIKLEKADAVYAALKKVYGKRTLELDVFRKEIRGRRFGGDEGDDG